MPLEMINEDWQGKDPTVGLCLLHPPDELLGSVQNFPNTKGSVCRNPALQGMLHVHMGQTNFNYMILFFFSQIPRLMQDMLQSWFMIHIFRRSSVH